MSVFSVVDQVCQFFGGPYDAQRHAYATPQIILPPLSVLVRRAAPMFDDKSSDYFASEVPGVTTAGCMIAIYNEGGGDLRMAPGEPGLRAVHHTLVMNVFLWSLMVKPEDMQDLQYRIVDTIRNRFYSDRTAGSGGFEAGIDETTGEGLGFQVGEATESGQSWFRWKMFPIETTPKKQTKAYVYVECDAMELRRA